MFKDTLDLVGSAILVVLLLKLIDWNPSGQPPPPVKPHPRSGLYVLLGFVACLLGFYLANRL